MDKKQLGYYLSLLLFLISCKGENNNYWVMSLPKPWTLNNNQVTEVLSEFQNKFPDFNERLKAINIWRVGTPYGLYVLGEEVEPDTDPLLRIDSSDCTVHVLTSLAFSSSSSWGEARKNMVKLHYKPDNNSRINPTYQSRWHFTSDRILNNPYTTDITRSVAQQSQLKSIKIILNKQNNGKEFLNINWTSDQLIYFIPTKNIDLSILSNLPSVCGVAFVRSSYFVKGIVIAHEGVLIDSKDLIHASSNDKKTVSAEFSEYIKNSDGSPKFDGVIFYSFNEVN